MTTGGYCTSRLGNTGVGLERWKKLKIESCPAPCELGNWPSGQTTRTRQAVERLCTEHGILRALRRCGLVLRYMTRSMTRESSVNFDLLCMHNRSDIIRAEYTEYVRQMPGGVDANKKQAVSELLHLM